MESMSSPSCPHGLPRGRCEICRLVAPAPGVGTPARRTFPGGLVTVVVVAIVGVVVAGWAAAAFFAVVRLLELVVVAAVAGWIGWKLGVHRGRRSS